jgi:hypothetical protein
MMFSSVNLVIVCRCLEVIHTINVIRGERTRYSMLCFTDRAHWIGPNNRSIKIDSNKYQIKSSSNTVQQLIIHQLNYQDQGEYVCENNHTNEMIQRYQLTVGTMKTILLPFLVLIIVILLIFPLCWLLGRKYSGLNR